MSECEELDVKLNVYDLNATDGKNYVTTFNSLSKNIGIGVFHSGVQVGDKVEFFYGFREEGTGVCHCKPAQALPEVYKFRETIEIGKCSMPMREVYEIIRNLQKSEQWQGPSYDITRHNCNSFSDEFCKILTGNGIPAWVNRVADGVSVARTGAEAAIDVAKQGAKEVQKGLDAIAQTETFQTISATSKEIGDKIATSETFQSVKGATEVVGQKVGQLFGTCLDMAKTAVKSTSEAIENEPKNPEKSKPSESE